MRRQAVWMAVLGALWFGPGLARGLDVGLPAPAFHLVSGDGRDIVLDQLKGKIVVLLYESREVVERNRPFKNELRALLDQSKSLKAATVVLSVIDCSSAVWPVTKIWQAKLRDNSEKERLTIYGDWDGQMAADYGMKDKDSNIVIIDPEGMVRYRGAGPLESGDREAVLSLLKLIQKGGS